MSSMYDWPSESDSERMLRQEKDALEKKLEIVEAGLSAAFELLAKKFRLTYGPQLSWDHVYDALDFCGNNVGREDIVKWHKQRFYELDRKKRRLAEEADRIKEEEQKRLLAKSAALKLTDEERRALGIYNMATAPTVIMPNHNRLDGKQPNEAIKDMGK